MVLLACAKRVVRDGGSDPEVYQAIRNTFHSEIACKYKKPASKDQKSAGRPDNRVKHIVNLLPQSFRPRTLLDVGCAEGTKLVEHGVIYLFYIIYEDEILGDESLQAL